MNGAKCIIQAHGIGEAFLGQITWYEYDRTGEPLPTAGLASIHVNWQEVKGDTSVIRQAFRDWRTKLVVWLAGSEWFQRPFVSP
jgi:hypothetical protein